LFLLSPEVWEGVGRDVIAKLSEPAQTEGNDLIISDEGISGGFAAPRPWHKKPRFRSRMGEVNALRRSSGLPHHHSAAAHFERIANISTKLGFDAVKVLIILEGKTPELPLNMQKCRAV